MTDGCWLQDETWNWRVRSGKTIAHKDNMITSSQSWDLGFCAYSRAFHIHHFWRAFFELCLCKLWLEVKKNQIRNSCDLPSWELTYLLPVHFLKMNVLFMQVGYCWWKRSCTTWDVQNLVNNGINYQPQLVSRISEPSTASMLVPYRAGNSSLLMDL